MWNPSDTDIKRIYADAASKCEVANPMEWASLSEAGRELMVRMVYATLRSSDERALAKEDA